ncbi:hypothetical protein [Streptomyces sp. NPDC058092]|uniref:hypothetical protein n=1 Tax=Streptomyces sp. NPDC058092 TaxID=3346336 RepID=UPI0036EB573A
MGKGIALAAQPDFTDIVTADALSRCGGELLDFLEDAANGRWTPEEDAWLSELQAFCSPVSDMSQEPGRNEGAIAARLERIIPLF